MGKLEVYGNSRFTADVTRGLHQLEIAFPYGFGLIQRYIRCVIEGDTPNPAKGSGIGIVYQKVTREGRKLGCDPQHFHFVSNQILRYERLIKQGAGSRFLRGSNA